MKKFLIGSCLIGLLMATAPAMADSFKREDHKAGYHQKVGHAKGAPHHKKFLTSQHRDRYADHGYRDRKHGWKHKKHSKRHHGWKHKKYQQRKHGYHGHKRHWNESRHHGHYNRGSRYRFRYNSGYHPVDQGAQLLIDVTR
ncbi:MULTISPECIES: hypothetical protein [Marinobacter]|uniref:hypothetical protein n=1 Tax=Marinobacter TaxID=2742 RepID=UPI001246A0CF|nr:MULTISPECIES: hypothetical protein [Marinobacter]MBL3556127.1 hypothetical protein [Marinobacter sp. JB05H06]